MLRCDDRDGADTLLLLVMLWMRTEDAGSSATALSALEGI